MKNFLFCILFMQIFTFIGNEIELPTGTLNSQRFLISEHNSFNFEALSEAYINRGENYLINNQADEAFDDFRNGYLLLQQIEDSEKGLYLTLRSLFGMIIGYCNLGYEDAAVRLAKELDEFVASLMCLDCQSKLPVNKNYLCSSTNSNLNILNPDKPPRPGWCQDVVRGTADTMRLLASYAKTAQAKATLLGIISSLESRCLQCCATGEFWKICVAPIIEKWKSWDDKWRVFSIPPDPAWDD